MNEWHAIKCIFGHRFKETIVKFAMIMICTIAFHMMVAIVGGVGLGLIVMVARLSCL